MNPLRLSLAAALGLLTAIAAAEPYLVCELKPGASPTGIATQYSVTLRDVTSDNSYALYEAATNTQANTVSASMATNSNIKSVSIQQFASMPPSKGSTLPVVGGRTELQAANDSLLGQINWSASLANSDGRTVKVAILDTGLADSQVALWSKVVAAQNFVEQGRLPIDRPLDTDSSNNGIADEGTGHGTMVAGVIDLVAPKTQFIIARVADSDGLATNWSIMKGIRFAVEQGAEVINLSLASPERNGSIRAAIQYAESFGVTVVAGIGNASQDRAFFPAAFESVVAVTSLDLESKKSPFSNWSERADAAAPGQSVVTQSECGTLAAWSGTSASSAFVSGIIADCLRRRGKISPFQIRNAITFTGQNVDSKNPYYQSKLGRLIDHKALDTALGN